MNPAQRITPRPFRPGRRTLGRRAVFLLLLAPGVARPLTALAQGYGYEDPPDAQAAAPSALTPEPPPELAANFGASKAYLKDALLLYRASRPAEAAAQLEQVLVDYPDDLEAWELLGQAYWKAGQADQALARWKMLTTLQPTCAPAYRWLGNIYAAADRLKEARAAYARSLEILPDSSDTRYRLARVTRWAGHLDEAVDLLEPLCKKYPDNKEYADELGRALYGNREYEAARPYWDAMAPRHKDPVTQIRWLGARLHTGDHAAIGEIERFVARHPEELEGLDLLATVYDLQSEFAASLELRKRQHRLEPDPKKKRRLLLRMANLYELGWEKDPAAFSLSHAIELLNTYLSEGPEDTDVRILLGEIQLQAREETAALASFLQVLNESNPENVRALRGAFEVCIALQRTGEAKTYMERLYRFNPADPYRHYVQARFAAARLQFSEAYAALDRLEEAGARGAVSILLYHGLTTSEWLEIPSAARYRGHLLALKEAGFVFLDPRQLNAYFAARALPSGTVEDAVPERVVCVTFDDARRDALRLGGAVNREVQALVGMHVPVGYVLREHPFIATWKQLTAAAPDNWIYGGHAMEGHEPRPAVKGGHPVHPLANRLWKEDAQRQETEEEYLERLEVEYGECQAWMDRELPAASVGRFFAYPFGDIGQLGAANVENAAAKNLAVMTNYYDLGFIQSQFGYAVYGDNPCLYQRTEPTRHEGGAELIARLLRMHPVFLARRTRAEIAAQDGRRHLAKKMVELLKRDGYPPGELTVLQAYIDRVAGRSLWSFFRRGKSAPAPSVPEPVPAAIPVKPAPPDDPAPDESGERPSGADDGMNRDHYMHERRWMLLR